MRLSMVCLSVAAAFTYAPLTAGQYPPPSSLPPPARVGFQLGLRTGLAVPLGDASKGEEMSNVFAPQVPIMVEIGGKGRRYFRNGHSRVVHVGAAHRLFSLSPRPALAASLDGPRWSVARHI
jgi:hypothetical protein